MTSKLGTRDLKTNPFSRFRTVFCETILRCRAKIVLRVRTECWRVSNDNGPNGQNRDKEWQWGWWTQSGLTENRHGREHKRMPLQALPTLSSVGLWATPGWLTPNSNFSSWLRQSHFKSHKTACGCLMGPAAQYIFPPSPQVPLQGSS